MKSALFLILLSLVPLSAQAGLWARCQDWYEGLNQHPDQALWESTFAPGGNFPHLPGGKEDLVLEGVRRLPGPIQQSLLKGSPHPALSNSSLLDQAERLRPSLFEKLRAFEARRTEADGLAFEAAVKEAQESHRWIQGAGRAELPLVTRGKETFVQIGPDSVRVKKEGDGYVFFVPRFRVSHSFDNPVSLEHVRELLQAGKKPPKTYEGVLAHDGHFYLSDGNHRFETDTRDLIPVRMGAPRTVGLRITLDLLGVTQPNAQAIHDYFSGKITWRNLLPERLQQNFVFDPKP